MTDKKVFTSIVKEDINGECYLEFPQELLNQMGWDEETLLEWQLHDDGSVVLSEFVDVTHKYNFDAIEVESKDE